MSYENPNQVIDTQSGQNLARMQQSIGSSFDKFATSKKTEWDRRAEANRKITDAANKRATTAQNSAIAEASKNKSINFDGINDVINKGNDILLKNPKNRTAEDRAYISNMDNMGTNIASTLANVAANGESYMKARSIKQGEEGGHSRDAGFTLPGPPEYFVGLQAADILFGYKGAPGSKVSRFDAATNDFYIDIYDEKGKLLQTVMDSDMSSLTNYQKVPVERKNQDKIGTEAIKTMDIANPTGIAYRDKNGKLNDLVKDTAVPGKTTYYRPISKDVFRQGAIAQVNAQVSALPANDAIAMYNNTLNPTGKKMRQRADFNDPGKIEEGWEKENRNAVLVSTETNLEISTLLPDGKTKMTIEQQQEKGKLVNKDLYEIQKSYLDAVVRQTEAVHTSKSLGTVDEFSRQMKRNANNRAIAKSKQGNTDVKAEAIRIKEKMDENILANVSSMYDGSTNATYVDKVLSIDLAPDSDGNVETITFDMKTEEGAAQYYKEAFEKGKHGNSGEKGEPLKLAFKSLIAPDAQYKSKTFYDEKLKEAYPNPAASDKLVEVMAKNKDFKEKYPRRKINGKLQSDKAYERMLVTKAKNAVYENWKKKQKKN